MNKLKYIAVIIILIFCSSCKDRTVQTVAMDQNNHTSNPLDYYRNEKVYAETVYKVEDLSNGSIYTRNVKFKNGDVYTDMKLEFIKDGEIYTHREEIFGENLIIRYYDEEMNFVETEDIGSGFPNKTLFLQTDSAQKIISTVSVFKNERILSTYELVPELSKGVAIEKTPGGYEIIYKIPMDSDVNTQFWFIDSKYNLINWSEDNINFYRKNELSGRFLWCEDGFYQKSHSTYYPTGENNYFKNQANFVGTNFITFSSDTYSSHMAYVMLLMCLDNMNEYGFYPTESRSEWLYNDFGIPEYFFDTRFNADTGSANLKAYEVYGDERFLDNTLKYGEFLLKYADTNKYIVGDGILLEDYYSPYVATNTHSSLNHHLANMNFLYELYENTKDERFLNLADKMLKGVEETKELWVLEDNNLKYALFYSGDEDLVDYPSLTYNDLFYSKILLSKLDRTSETIEYLMEHKKDWMDKNHVLDYKK